MTTKTWNIPVHEGDDPIGPNVHADFPVDTRLFNFHKKRPTPGSSGETTESDSQLAGIVPKVLTNLSNRVGFASGLGVDVNLVCEDIPGVVRYEIRISPA